MPSILCLRVQAGTGQDVWRSPPPSAPTLALPRERGRELPGR